ncbi:MAG: hypothetical protein K2X08_08100, partial [Chlamydiales bacterium]|nr:hypothetical protein [Chlamydiales bacterium]
LKEIMPKIHKNFLELENKLYRNVDQINSDLEKKFKEMKQWLMHLNRERGAAINELHSEFEKLTQESVL